MPDCTAGSERPTASPPGQVTSQGPILRRGIGRLHFAGEHSAYAFMGYVEGALSSGAAAARRIAGRDGVVRAGQVAVAGANEL